MSAINYDMPNSIFQAVTIAKLKYKAENKQ